MPWGNRSACGDLVDLHDDDSLVRFQYPEGQDAGAGAPTGREVPVGGKDRVIQVCDRRAIRRHVGNGRAILRS